MGGPIKCRPTIGSGQEFFISVVKRNWRESHQKPCEKLPEVSHKSYVYNSKTLLYDLLCSM